MADEMSLKQLPLTLIVAATPTNGIGRNGGLPWPMLKKEMAYFARVTKRLPTPTSTGSTSPINNNASRQTSMAGARKNVVIMGRKTWESIPTKFRPLKDRTNVVLSTKSRTELGSVPDDVVVASNILHGLESLEQRVRNGEAAPVGRAFVIGGSSIYQAAMELEQTKAVLLTRIAKDYECDTFFPGELGESSAGWQRKSREDLQAFVGEEISEHAMTDGSDGELVSFEFQLYERP
ncbi:hypothetical protein B0A50_03196 [Salinomyces thailandicus]|uniref:Dihydrofolate reductase n=1 Tax=Salinomyces thailandicus TaxID=706561 RepID=A0A4U0U5H6_9PEZI|nr:hypothetical protein B0A50_03196 [Salinomyces thailandica]